MGEYAASLEDIRQASLRIRPHTHRTPVFTCSTLDAMAGRALYFKCENLQRGGSFKMRGATNALLSLPAPAAARGVVTHSSGNFAQALALAAAARQVEAHIVMPKNTLAVKRRAVEEAGARVYLCEPTLAAREETADQVRAATAATFVHPYDDPAIIAGQGTAALELLDEVPDLDGVVAPIGGGGLMSGTCLAVRGLSPRALLFAAEPAGADDAARSLAAGELIPQTDPLTIADGLRTSLGELTWPIVRDHLEEVVTVSEEEILAALGLVLSRMKLVVEPSAAVAVAAVLSPGFRAREGLRRLGVILSGGNLDLEHPPWLP